MRNLMTAATLAALVLAPESAMAQRLAKPSGTQKLQQATMNDVPKCPTKHGTISIVDGDDPSGWTQYSLAAPSKLLKVLVQRSGCFNLVDRGSGLQAAQLERNIGGNLGLQRGANVGQGQIKQADYVLQAEVQAANGNASGSGIGAGVGGIIGGPFGGLIGGIRSRKQEANVVLSITNVRTTETLATEDGYAAKNSISFGGGGGVFGGMAGGGVVGGGYDNTDIGRIVTLAFIQAYAKLVDGLGYVRAGDTGTAEAAPKKTYTTMGPVAMRVTPTATGKVVRTLPPGSILYLSGEKQGMWWQVADENDNTGWVMNTKLEPSR
ncbi:CsgG/HfaB family protein [Sphingomonas immobilis]|uniref:CsgG/HfaB family protein n=1 Tax=Sphingomonas immobilis TaxID=3063997 RepID=A0ABT8ZV05_9SPHN|nr:CsgG/HfaB family protein [Sphingomonas sp. CA1-15]MDO7840964.1 CsgG/HfaB family protein [Sphingomonas sp. CA1-15]